MSRKEYRAKMRAKHGPDWWKTDKKPAKKGQRSKGQLGVIRSPEDAKIAKQKKRLEALYREQGSWGSREDDRMLFFFPAGPDYKKYDLIFPGKVTITSEVMTYFGGNPNNLPIAFVTEKGNEYVRVSKTYKNGFTVQDLEDFIKWSMDRTGDHHHSFFEGLERTKVRPLTYTLDMGS